jgi:hypothetical protein
MLLKPAFFISGARISVPILPLADDFIFSHLSLQCIALPRTEPIPPWASPDPTEDLAITSPWSSTPPVSHCFSTLNTCPTQEVHISCLPTPTDHPAQGSGTIEAVPAGIGLTHMLLYSDRNTPK